MRWITKVAGGLLALVGPLHLCHVNFFSYTSIKFNSCGGEALGRCLLDAPGTLVLVQAHMLPSWKAALQDSATILCIPNHKKMRPGSSVTRTSPHELVVYVLLGFLLWVSSGA